MKFLPIKDYDLAPLQSGPLFAYVGAGLSMGSGLVGWNEMAFIIWRFMKYYERAKNMPTCPKEGGLDNAKFLKEFINERDMLGKKILSSESTDARTFGRTVLLNLLLRYRAPRTELILEKSRNPPEPVPRLKTRRRYGEEPSAEDLVPHSLIWRMGCQGVITPNYDMFLEHAFSLFGHGSSLRSYRYTANYLKYILSNRRFVLKLHGDINSIGSMLLDPHGAWEPGGGYSQHQKNELCNVYAHTLKNGHMIYVGFGFQDRTINELHRFWREWFQPSSKLRIALVPEKEVDAIKKALLGIPFDDVLFLTYTSKPGIEVRAFLTEIADLRGHASNRWLTCPESVDIYRQIFRNLGEKPRQRLNTKPWSCQSRAKEEPN